MKNNIGHLRITVAENTGFILSNPLRTLSIRDRLEAIPDKFMTGNTTTFTGIPALSPDEDGVRFIPMRSGALPPRPSDIFFINLSWSQFHIIQITSVLPQ